MVKGIARRIDPLGRITLPMEIRRSLKINEEDLVDIYLKDGVICIESVKLQCTLCGSREEDQLIQVDGIHICMKCTAKIKQI